MVAFWSPRPFEIAHFGCTVLCVRTFWHNFISIALIRNDQTVAWTRRITPISWKKFSIKSSSWDSSPRLCSSTPTTTRATSRSWRPSRGRRPSSGKFPTTGSRSSAWRGDLDRSFRGWKILLKRSSLKFTLLNEYYFSDFWHENRFFEN